MKYYLSILRASGRHFQFCQMGPTRLLRLAELRAMLRLTMRADKRLPVYVGGKHGPKRRWRHSPSPPVTTCYGARSRSRQVPPGDRCSQASPRRRTQPSHRGTGTNPRSVSPHTADYSYSRAPDAHADGSQAANSAGDTAPRPWPPAGGPAATPGPRGGPGALAPARSSITPRPPDTGRGHYAASPYPLGSVASTAANGVGCVDEFITEFTGRGPSKLYGTRFWYSTTLRDGYGTAASRVRVI